MADANPGGTQKAPVEAERRQLGAGAIAGLSGVGLLLIFMLQNTEDVKINFLFWGFTWPLWLYTFVITLVGALVWIGWGIVRRHRRRRARREDRSY